MDSAPISTLRHRLQTYNTVVRNHRQYCLEHGGAFNAPAYSPYYERHQVLVFFNVLASEGTDIPSALWQEYAAITRCFGEYEQVSGPALRRRLLDELLGLIQVYQAALCYAFLGSPFDPSSPIPVEREIIGILLAELKKDHDLFDLERLLVTLDDNVTCIAATLDESVPEMNSHPLIFPDSTPARCDKGIP